MTEWVWVLRVHTGQITDPEAKKNRRYAGFGREQR